MRDSKGGNVRKAGSILPLLPLQQEALTQTKVA
jgi:hypothetical protein